MMTPGITQQIAKHFREVHFGGNWTCSNVKETLSDISWEEARKKVEPLNEIVTLVYHINYYVDAVLKVLNGGALEAKDEYSFTHGIKTAEEWNKLKEKVLHQAEEFAKKVEQLPDERLWENFTDPKYGSYYRNLHGIIEHTHYHLGQVAIIKKLIRTKDTN
jgi:uncharacterized damage-inducible protein DinB